MQTQAETKGSAAAPVRTETTTSRLFFATFLLLLELLPSSHHLFICIFSLERSSSPSFRPRRCRGACSLPLQAGLYQTHQYVLSALCIIAPPPPVPFHQAHLTSPARERRPPPVYTLHTTFYINQSEAGAGRQTWKAHSYSSGSIHLDLVRERQGRSEEP